MATMPLIDRLIAVVSPRAAYQRQVYRRELTRAYEAASPRDPWRPVRMGASASADHAADATMLRAKARALVQNVPYADAAIQYRVSATIGTGIVACCKDAALLALWQQWSERAIVGGARGRSLVAGVRDAQRARDVDGEVLLRIRSRRPSDGLPVPIQIQVLEIDWLDTEKSGKNGANTIVEGIEYDPVGSVVAYWLFDQHPGDVNGWRGRLANKSRAVPADRIIHYSRPGRPGQERGITRFASVISRIRDLQTLEDSELARKNLESRLGVVASGHEAMLPQHGGTADPAAGGAVSLGDIAGGGIVAVPAGLNITTIQPQIAPGYIDNLRMYLHLIATGLGVPYWALTGDMREASFSSNRMRVMDFRRDVEQEQQGEIIPDLMLPIWRAFVDAAYLAGKARSPEAEVTWTVPRHPYLEPLVDAQAGALSLQSGQTTFSEHLRERGWQPDQFWAEWEQDWKRMQSSGMADWLSLMLKGRTFGEAQAQAQNMS